MSKLTEVIHTKKVKLIEGNNPLIEPIYRSVKYTVSSVKHSISDSAKEFGFEYSRDKNPTTYQLEQVCASLQEREIGVATSSGMAAIWCVLLANLSAGDRVVFFLESYAPTRKLIRDKLSKLGITCSMVSVYDESAIADELAKDDTKLIIYESITNPMLCIPNHAWIVQQANKNNVITLLDNTFLGLHNHCDLKVDYIIHSLTKFANGHGDAMGGMVLGSKQSMKSIRDYATSLGATPDPEASYLILRGLKTYFMRYQKQCDSAFKIARYFEGHSNIAKVFYPGLNSAKNYKLLPKNVDGYGAMITFEIDCNEEKLWQFIDNLKLFSTAASLGSVDSLVAPIKLFFGKDLNQDELVTSGIKHGSVRFAVGLEDPEDLLEDIEQALRLLD